MWKRARCFYSIEFPVTQCGNCGYNLAANQKEKLGILSKSLMLILSPAMMNIARSSAGSFGRLCAEVVEEYLRCGDLHEGFARVRCPILNATMDLPRS